MDGSEARLVRLRDVVRTPWRNGLGTTRELATSGVGEGEAQPSWRVSLADITAGGAFSSFEGYDRHFTVVGGAGVVLTVDGADYRVGSLESCAFRGEAATRCRLLGGGVLALNVMTRRGDASAQVDLVVDALTVASATGEAVFVMDVSGGALVDERDTLDRLDGFYVCGTAPVAVRPNGPLLVARLRR